MVDSVLIVADSSPSTRRVVEGAEDVREVREWATDTMELQAKVGNLRVSLRADGTLRVTGSLTKFVCGNNIENLTRRGVEEASRQLAGVLHFDAEAARVYRLDVGATLEMPRPPRAYLVRVIGADRYRRKEYSSETVLLQAGWALKPRRCLQFYDKSREAGVTDRHLLRFEVQFQKKVKEQLEVKLTLADLYASDVFGQLVRRWQSEFDGVHLARYHKLEPPKGVKDLKQQLARVGLKATGGPAVVVDVLSAWRTEGYIGKSQHYRAKKCVLELATSGAAEEDQKVVEELNRAVERAERRALSTEARTFKVDLN